MREKGFAICVENRGAEDLEVRKVYRVLHDKDAAATGYVRVIDESGDDYLYPADYFVFVEFATQGEARVDRDTGYRQATEFVEEAASADRDSRCSLRPLSAVVRQHKMKSRD
ncbi:MAG: hypothetical protein DMD94_14655 [Candidatus Rokuibacteriota bacterium]|nr:MAG: hypothetical protein DMD94_14655 [Candidatus Rokubacteria bacterium]